MDRLLVFDEYCQLIDGIQYFHEEQTEMRFLTSKILLGTFSIIGAIFFTQIGMEVRVKVLFVAAIIPLMSIGIITVNLAQDLVVKERLRLSCLSEALRLENEYSWLPRFHILMMHHQKKTYHGSGHKKLAYYLGCILILIVLSTLSFSFTDNFSSLIARLVIATLGIVFFIAYSYIFLKLVGKGHLILGEIEDE